MSMEERTELANLVRDGKYDKALELLDRAEDERKLSLPELVTKGMMIQVASESRSHHPAESRQAFEAALAIDENYIPALLELAFFNHMVEDESAEALPLFEKAIDLSLRHLREAVLGKMKCLEELESLEVAIAFLRQISQECVDTKSLKMELLKSIG
jgi:tetratricopeptide (TPR) repeat protein